MDIADGLPFDCAPDASDPEVGRNLRTLHRFGLSVRFWALIPYSIKYIVAAKK
jgi:hypothetical protein